MLKQSHSSNKKFGMGDHYGTGVKNKSAKIKSDSVGYIPISKIKMKKPPKALA